VILDDDLVDRLYRLAQAERWDLSRADLGEALHRSATRASRPDSASPRAVARDLESLHLVDLALACACANGHDGAWDYFVTEHRPGLYRAADAIDSSGNARELADSLYAELYGMDGDGRTRQSLFRYYHGRSSLATWLRAVLAQRHVDHVRRVRRFDALPDEQAMAAPSQSPGDPKRARWRMLFVGALTAAVGRLTPRERLRLMCYYDQALTLAQIGRLTKEHEATVSRQLSRTRLTIRRDVEHKLRAEADLSEAEISECFASIVEDPGTISLAGVVKESLPQETDVESF
jgi:RNA polymerase sigma-70 factor (ECF subfamily)